MAQEINKRRLKLIYNRLRNLPEMGQFKKYLINRTALYFAVRKKSPVVPYPTSLMIELTNHCQLNCITCAREYAFGSQMDTGNINLEKTFGLIDEAIPYLDKIGLTGLGEPLINKDIEKIVDYIRSKSQGIALFISTNAQLKGTTAIIERLADKIDTLQISIDGVNDVFEKVRAGSDFKSFKDNVFEIVNISRNRRVKAKLNMVSFSMNYFQMSEVVDFASEAGINEISFNTINLVANDWDLTEYDVYKSDEYIKAVESATAKAKSKNIFVEFPKFSLDKGFKNCPYMWNHFYVTWDAYLAVCCAKPFPKEQHFGNVFEAGLLNCINNNGFQKFRKLSADKVDPDYCSRCHYLM